ncbi:MAG: hypothetical protein VKI83_03225 [Synechococcaceae cyanobacterium]|nr:hypothetical protein [Synechococcaceae cyanobacterium]
MNRRDREQAGRGPAVRTAAWLLLGAWLSGLPSGLIGGLPGAPSGGAGSGAALAAPRTPSAHTDTPPPRRRVQAPREPASASDFGRWEMPISNCQLARQGDAVAAIGPQRCLRVRLDQQLPGLLSIRFMAPAAAARPTEAQLVFAGVLEPGSPAMRCRDGACAPRGTMRLQVSAVAETGLNPQGTLLQAQLARGQCLWEEGRLRCEASAPNGASWRAEAGAARMSPMPP